MPVVPAYEVYDGSFLSVSDGFQSSVTPYYYFINPIGHIAITSQLSRPNGDKLENDTVVRTEKRFPQYHNFGDVRIKLAPTCRLPDKLKERQNCSLFDLATRRRQPTVGTDEAAEIKGLIAAAMAKDVMKINPLVSPSGSSGPEFGTTCACGQLMEGKQQQIRVNVAERVEPNELATQAILYRP